LSWCNGGAAGMDPVDKMEIMDVKPHVS